MRTKKLKGTQFSIAGHDPVHGGTAHLYLGDPFRGRPTSWFTRLFQTHPPIEDRIRILRGLDAADASR